ncbi:Duplicated ATPase component MtsB of energizing module of methionine-regulated ECF transporter [Clostridiaceae bacterium JG1575]|nr:Duplicated ATPase component MtsB of energizing module of methionine-regulated ECF transporter [Clostridiaceae bacterium JG1575]
MDHNPEPLKAPTDAMGQESILTVEGLSFRYPDGQMALKEVSFSVRRGSRVFFHGRNGAGKTTLFQCLCGLLRPKVGTILLSGQPMPREKDRMAHVSIVFQNANDQIIAGSVYDEVAFGPLNQGLEEQTVRARVEEALHALDLWSLKEKPPHFLSYGQKKRVTIASILSMQPDLMLLDEPSAGLDQEQTEELVRIFKKMSQRGTTLLISTHDTDFSYRLADQVILLSEGELLADGSSQTVFQDDELLQRCGLKKPMILDFYEVLRRNGSLPLGKEPREREDFLELLRGIQRVPRMCK